MQDILSVCRRSASQKIFTNFSRKSAEGMQCCSSLVYTSFPTSCYVQACPFDPAYSGSVCREADQKCNKVFANVLARMPVEILRSLCQASNSVFPLRVSPSSTFWQLHVRQDSWIFIRNFVIHENSVSSILCHSIF